MGKDFLTREGQGYKDFTLITSKKIQELQITLREIIHQPTGAQIMHLENDDPENVFCLSFKTLPSSSNGVPHILEHTVLCGSKKFPVKDPFFAMSRRSLNTFMNALTGSDFTCYPAATQVEKDFYNLLEVYLDAVFHPKLKELSFLQEGHRLEFSQPDNPKSSLEFKGIVYNEMKGALSSVDSRIWHAMLEKLVPDLPYAYNSGGDPREIPDLTYEKLIEFHETYYHPSRCLFFFYGNFPLKKHLDFIEEHALKGVPKMPQIEGIGHQKRFTKPVFSQAFYPTHEKEELETKHLHAFGWLTAPLLNQEEILALTILDSVLMDTDASPLKKALLETKMCVHADSFLDIEMTEVPLIMIFRGCKKEDGEKLHQAVLQTLEQIAKQGIPFSTVEASIHQLEFSRTEIGGDHSPFGLTLFMRSALTKQHGCNPEHSLTIHSLFEELTEKAKNPHFFTPLIEKHFLQNPHFVHLCFSPDPELSAKEAQEEKEKLESIKKKLTEKEIAKILDQTRTLEKFQKISEGSKLDCLPKVTLKDVPEEARHFILDTYRRKNLEIFHHETFTNHIIYGDLFIDLPSLNEEELFDLQLFSILWTELGIGKRSFEENLEFVHAHTGGIGTHTSLHVQANDPMRLKPSLQLHGKALGRKKEKLFLLFKEMLTQPRFDEKERIKDMIKKLANSLENRLNKNAMRYTSYLALSSFSPASHINELWYGLSFYKKVLSLSQEIDHKLSSFIDRMVSLKTKLLKFAPLHLVLSCDETLFQELDAEGFYGLTDLRTHPPTPWEYNASLTPITNQARAISSPVAFTTQGYSTINYSHKDAPALQVSTLLLENLVLHHRIREQGGAYGSGASYNPIWGNFHFYAYRDPHIAHTLRTFSDSIEEIASGEFDENDLEQAKLGIIQHFDTPTSPGNRALVAYNWMRSGKTRQMRQNYRDRLLSLSRKDVQSALEQHLKSQTDKGTIVTFAGEDLINKELPLIEEKKMKFFSLLS